MYGFYLFEVGSSNFISLFVHVLTQAENSQRSLTQGPISDIFIYTQANKTKTIARDMIRGMFMVPLKQEEAGGSRKQEL